MQHKSSSDFSALLTPTDCDYTAQTDLKPSAV